jgi:hypothetical protein
MMGDCLGREVGVVLISSSGEACSVTEDLGANSELLKGDAPFLAGLRNNDVRAGNAGVEVEFFSGECMKEAPSWPFRGDIFNGEAWAGVKFGAEMDWERRFLVESAWLNLNGEISGRLAGLDMNIDSLKSIFLPGGSTK